MANPEHVEAAKKGKDFFNRIQAGGQYRCDLSNETFKGVNFSGYNFSRVLLNNSVFIKCNISGCIFDGSNMEKCVFRNVQSNEGHLSFRQVIITYAKFIDCSFHQLQIQDIDQSINTTEAEFINCSFYELTITNTKFDSVKLVKSTFVRGTFSMLVCKCTDISNSSFNYLQFGAQVEFVNLLGGEYSPGPRNDRRRCPQRH